MNMIQTNQIDNHITILFQFSSIGQFQTESSSSSQFNEAGNER